MGPQPGKTLFHVALAGGLLPGFGTLLSVVLALQQRRSVDPWARRLLVLAACDVLLLAVLVALKAGDGLPRLEGAQAPPRPRVGVQLHPEQPRIVSVLPDSPAAEAGLQVGDELLGLDGRVVESAAKAVEDLRRLPVGREVAFSIRRDGEPKVVAVVPRDGPWTDVKLFEARPVPEGSWLGWSQLAPFVLIGLLGALTAWRAPGPPPVWPAFALIDVGALMAAGGTLWIFFRLQGGLSMGATLIALGMQSLAFAGGALLANRVRPHSAPAPEDALPSGKAVLLGTYYLITLLPRAALLVAGLLALPIEGLPRPQDPVGALASGGLPPAAMALLAIDVVVLAPLAEEMLFRGFLLPRLAARLRPTLALLATAVLFAALHTHYGVQALVLVVHGVVLGWARLRTGRLAASVALHMAVNAVALAAGLLSRS